MERQSKNVYYENSWLGEFIGFEKRKGYNIDGEFTYLLVKLITPNRVTYLRDFTKEKDTKFSIR